MLKTHNFNFVAGESLTKGEILALDATNTDSQHIAVKPLAAAGDITIGIAGSDAVAGDAVDFVTFEVGKVVNVIAGGTYSAGDQLGTLPLVAIDAASDADDVIRAICVAIDSTPADDGGN